MFSVVPSVCLSVCLSRFTPLTVWTLDTASAFWLVKLKPDLIQPSTDKTSLSQPKTDDISFDKSQLLQCGGIHGHYVPLVDALITFHNAACVCLFVECNLAAARTHRSVPPCGRSLSLPATLPIYAQTPARCVSACHVSKSIIFL